MNTSDGVADPRATRIRLAGRGAVSGFGVGAPVFLDAVFAGRSAIRPLERLADGAHGGGVAAEVPADVLAAAGSPRGLPLHMARVAAEEALEDARAGTRERACLGLVLATTKADLSGVTPLLPGEARAATHDAAGLGVPRVLLARLADVLGVGGPTAALTSACASGCSALALAARWLAAGRVASVLVVGTDSLTPFVLAGFGALLALAPEPCRPFDRGRRGLSLGEGAGALLLRAEDDADAANARDTHDARHAGDAHPAVYLAGWGEANDSHHVTGPSRDGRGLRLAAERALRCAGLVPGEVDALHLHGTGTPYNDAMEGAAVRALFERPPPGCGSKAQHGHALGATGVLEVIVAAEMLRRGVVPPNVGLAEPDADVGLPLRAEPVDVPRARTVLKLAAGFGGIDAAIVLALRDMHAASGEGRGTRGDDARAGDRPDTLRREDASPHPRAGASRPAPRITAFGLADEDGLSGSAAPTLLWDAAGIDVLGAPVSWRAVHAHGTRDAARPWPEFRRLDRLTRMLALAAEAAGLDAVLDAARRERTALILASAWGCLDSDVRFADGLRRPADMAPRLFPYTLPSTALGELAIRHGLRGPTLCLSVDAGSAGVASALDAARRLLDADDADAVFCACGDWLPPDTAAAVDVTPRTSLAVLLIERGPAGPGDALSWSALHDGRTDLGARLAELR